MKEDDLSQLFADLTDDALLARIRSGDLTDLASSTALAEAARRRLDVPAIPPPNVKEVVLPPPDYVQLSGYLQPMEAYLLQGRLQTEGIDAHLLGVKTIEANPLWFNALGGVRIFVPRAQCERANGIVAMQRAGDFGLEGDGPAAKEESGSSQGKRWFGWIVLVLPASIFSMLGLVQIWESHCEPNTYCVILEQQQSMADYFVKLIVSALILAPAAIAIQYLRLRFKPR
jgi:hypothetical protein